MPVSGDTRIIQVLLLAAVVIFTVMLTRSTAGARHQAIRRLGLMFFVALAAFSVLFPSWLSTVAGLVGVGRGTDLVLYVLVVVFVGYVIVTARGTARRERAITVLARRVAIWEAVGAPPSGSPAAGGPGPAAPDDAAAPGARSPASPGPAPGGGEPTADGEAPASGGAGPDEPRPQDA